MPLPIYYAHRLMQRQAEVRKDGRLPWLRPDAKSQLTVKYVDGKPVAIDTVVVSTQHDPDVSHAQISRSGDRGDHQAGAAEGAAQGKTATWSTRPGASSSAARTATAA
jgi:hypothetical protein